MSKVCEWSEVAAQGGKGGRIVRWHGRRGGKARNEVAIWERWEVSQQRRWNRI